MWAPLELYYIRHVTIVFLVSVLIGVSVYSMNPSEIYMVEPFMLMHVAYCVSIKSRGLPRCMRLTISQTYYMGWLRPPSPYLLLWERQYLNFFTNALVGIALHGYDLWYWWVGQKLMKPTPGTATFGLFVYFGRQDLTGFIKYPIKVYLIYFICDMLKKCLQFLYYRRLEKRLDFEVPPTRLKRLCESWQKEQEATLRTDSPPEGMIQSSHLLSPPSHSRQPSSNSLRSISSIKARKSTSSRHELEYPLSGRASPALAGSIKDDYGEKSLNGNHQ
jgi:hypothetical protein